MRGSILPYFSIKESIVTALTEEAEISSLRLTSSTWGLNLYLSDFPVQCLNQKNIGITQTSLQHTYCS